MGFQNYRAPVHFSADVRSALDTAYPERGSGRGGPVNWLALSPDFSCLDVLLWGHMKSLVYASPVDSNEALVARIAVVSGDIREMSGVLANVRQSLRLHLCWWALVRAVFVIPQEYHAYSDEDIRLSESDCEKSEESADVIDTIPVNPDIYVSRAQIEFCIIVMLLADLRLEMSCDKVAFQQTSRNMMSTANQEKGHALSTLESRCGANNDSREIFIWREPGTRCHPSNITESGRLDFTFMNDDARLHRANLFENFLEEEGFFRKEKPAKSPDLNNIEHVWKALERSISRSQYYPNTHQGLKSALIEEWKLMSQEEFNNLIRSL
ncbi:uncharacterized protein TNCV_3954291 [Trichonephila clavipes]|nr:uncharacterized protein TNCV_3954291 [Trichonephila clavipes]